MPQSLSSILVHLVFSTKNREPFITPAIETELHPYLATIFREHDSPSLIINGTAEHIHALFALGRTITVADLVEEVKTNSSKWIKTKGVEFKNFHWQKATGHSRSVSQTSSNWNGTFAIRNNITVASRLKTNIVTSWNATRLNLMNDIFGIDFYLAPSGLGSSAKGALCNSPDHRSGSRMECDFRAPKARNNSKNICAAFISRLQRSGRSIAPDPRPLA